MNIVSINRHVVVPHSQMEQDGIFSSLYISLLQLPIWPFNFLKRWFIILSSGPAQPSRMLLEPHTYVTHM